MTRALMIQLCVYGCKKWMPNGPVTWMPWMPGLDPEKRAAPTTVAHGNVDSAGGIPGVFWKTRDPDSIQKSPHHP